MSIKKSKSKSKNYSSIIQDVSLVYSSDESADGSNHYFEDSIHDDDESTTLMIDNDTSNTADARQPKRRNNKHRSKEHFGEEEEQRGEHPSRFFRRPGRLSRFFVVLTCIAFALAVVSSCLVLWVGDAEAASDWIEDTWELGLKGIRAQRIADRSSIHVVEKPSFSSKRRDDDDIPLLGSERNPPRYNATTVLTHNNNNNNIAADGGYSCEATVMLIRHCEKGSLQSHCNYVGFERAAYLATLFGNGDRWPQPSAIYALETKRNRHQNLREVETVRTVALNAQLEINDEYGVKRTAKLADSIVKRLKKSSSQSSSSGGGGGGDNNMCGKLILVSWKHSDIPRLARHLGKEEGLRPRFIHPRELFGC
jgi:hypothetical protein